MNLSDLPDDELLWGLLHPGTSYGERVSYRDELARRLSSLRAERDEALDRANGGSHEDWLRESELRVAAEAERDEAYEDSRRSLDRLNRLVAAKTGGIDPHTTDDYLAHRLHVESEGRKAAEADRDRLAEALEEIAADKTPGATRCIVQQKIARAALAARKEKG